MSERQAGPRGSRLSPTELNRAVEAPSGAGKAMGSQGGELRADDTQ